MKQHPIVIGFDDATFAFDSKIKRVSLIGVVCQGIRMVRVLQKSIKIDGDDATEALISLVLKVKKLVQYILTHSITFGGFNLIDMNEIYNRTRIPIISITEKEVNLPSVKKALIKNFPNTYKDKLQKIVNAGKLYNAQIQTAGGKSDIFFHSKGMDIDKIDEFFNQISIDSKLPEAIRMAHLIGKAFKTT